MSLTYIPHGRLKCWIQFFEDVWTGKKGHEIRFNDRDFKTNQIYRLIEFDRVENANTGRAIDIVITYVSRPDAPGLAAGYCVFDFIVLNHIGIKGD